MRGPPARVGGGVQLDAQPGRVPADPLANRRRVLADAGGEHDRVEAAQRGGERAEFAPDPVDEQIDRLRARAVVDCEQRRACRCDMPDTPSSPDCL